VARGTICVTPLFPFYIRAPICRDGRCRGGPGRATLWLWGPPWISCSFSEAVWENRGRGGLDLRGRQTTQCGSPLIVPSGPQAHTWRLASTLHVLPLPRPPPAVPTADAPVVACHTSPPPLMASKVEGRPPSPQLLPSVEGAGHDRRGRRRPRHPLGGAGGAVGHQLAAMRRLPTLPFPLAGGGKGSGSGGGQ